VTFATRFTVSITLRMLLVKSSLRSVSGRTVTARGVGVAPDRSKPVAKGVAIPVCDGIVKPGVPGSAWGVSGM
jgi:hypothetical protein